jgi:hypothetical protein
MKLPCRGLVCSVGRLSQSSKCNASSKTCKQNLLKRCVLVVYRIRFRWCRLQQREAQRLRTKEIPHLRAFVLLPFSAIQPIREFHLVTDFQRIDFLAQVPRNIDRDVIGERPLSCSSTTCRFLKPLAPVRLCRIDVYHFCQLLNCSLTFLG